MIGFRHTWNFFSIARATDSLVTHNPCINIKREIHSTTWAKFNMKIFIHIIQNCKQFARQVIQYQLTLSLIFNDTHVNKKHYTFQKYINNVIKVHWQDSYILFTYKFNTTLDRKSFSYTNLIFVAKRKLVFWWNEETT